LPLLKFQPSYNDQCAVKGNINYFIFTVITREAAFMFLEFWRTENSIFPTDW